jgi:hypothetical protein
MYASPIKSIYCYMLDNYKTMKSNIIQKQFTEAQGNGDLFNHIVRQGNFWNVFNIYSMIQLTHSVFRC